MRISLIGPVSPLRGGISHSNEVLQNNLRKKHELFTVSFVRLFPKILYPGKQQVSGNKKNFGKLDSINPLSWFREAGRINEFKSDSVLFQWWTTFLFPCYLTMSFLVKGKKIAMCQNIFPHKEGGLKDFVGTLHKTLSLIFLSQMDALVAMSKEDMRTLREKFPGKKITLYLEPMYEIEGMGKPLPKKEAKKALNLEGKNVILFFGFVREYKGLEYLLRAMPKAVKESGAYLLIVGEFWEPKEKYEKIISEVRIEKNVTIVDRYVGNEEVVKYFSAADVLVLPYLSISESGVIRMAFNFDLPIISTNVGGNPDHISNGANGFLVKPRDSKELAAKIVKFFSEKLYQQMSRKMKEKRKELEWSEEKEKAVLGNN